MSRVLARPLDTRTIGLSVAGLMAVGTGVLTYNYLASVGHSSSAMAQRTLLVAAKPIAAHTVLTAAMLQRTTRPADAVDPDAILVPENAIGATTVNPIPAGSQITSSKLVRYAASGLPGRVHVGMRAVAIALDRVKGVSNLIQAGDKVDVIATTMSRLGEAPKAVTIIRGATVLSVGSFTDGGPTPAPDGSIGTSGSSSTVFQSATLEVTTKQADLLALADVNTTLRLALRSPHESLHSVPAEKLVLGGQQQIAQQRPVTVPNPIPAMIPGLFGPRPQVAQQPAAAPSTPKPISSVSVIDGDRVVQPGSAR